MSASTIRFKAKAAAGSITLPKSVKGATVDGVINGLPFQANVTKRGGVEISDTMNRILKVNDGDIVSVEITRVGDETETRVPADLKKKLSASAKALATWVDITPIARRDWIFWIISGKLAETRVKRIEKAQDMLSHGKRRVCCFGGVQWLMKGRK